MTASPEIVFVTITFDPEPGALRGLPLAKWLVQRGYRVKVLTAFPQYPIGKTFPGYKQKLWQWESMDGIDVLRVPIYPSHDTNPIRRIWTYLSFMLSASTVGVALIGSADIVYLYEPPPTNGLASLLIGALRRAPIVHHIADMWPDTVISSGMVSERKWVRNAVERLLGSWCRFLYARAAAMSVLSPGFKRILIERGVPAEKIHVVYNWADESLFSPAARDEAFAEELGITHTLNFVYAGNMGPMQGIETVLRAAKLVQHDPRVRIVLIGTGPMEAEAKKLAAELRLSNVLFVARREYREMPRVNSVSDVMLVHLRDFDFLAATIPSKTQVALASGRPLLLAVRGDAADLIRAANAGITCDPEDPEAMADAILRFAAMPRDELEQLGRNGREYYATHLSLEVAGEQMDGIFKHVIAASGRKRRQVTGSEVLET